MGGDWDKKESEIIKNVTSKLLWKFKYIAALADTYSSGNFLFAFCIDVCIYRKPPRQCCLSLDFLSFFVFLHIQL